MMNKTKNTILLIVSLISFALVSVSVFVMFFTVNSSDSGSSAVNLACGVAFWLFLVVGIVLQAVVSVNVKKVRRKLSGTKFARKRVGLLNAFCNIPATVSDVLLVISTILFIICIIKDAASIFAYISLSVLFLSFSAHCIFNGKNYYCITNYEWLELNSKKSEEK